MDRLTALSPGTQSPASPWLSFSGLSGRSDVLFLKSCPLMAWAGTSPGPGQACPLGIPGRELGLPRVCPCPFSPQLGPLTLGNSLSLSFLIKAKSKPCPACAINGWITAAQGRVRRILGVHTGSLGKRPQSAILTGGWRLGLQMHTIFCICSETTDRCILLTAGRMHGAEGHQLGAHCSLPGGQSRWPDGRAGESGKCGQ